MQCPECGAKQPDGTVICSACDAILDTSFLEDDDALAEEEPGTDPGIALKASEEEGEAGTQIFDTAALEDERARREESTENFDTGEAGTYVGAAPAPPVPVPDEDDGDYEFEDEAEDDDEYEDDEPPAAPAPAADEAFDYRKYVPEEQPPAPPAASPRTRAGAIGRPRGAAPSRAVSSGSTTGESAGVRSALEFDTSSQMMDDYELMIRQAWSRFMALPATEKVSLVGVSLAAITVLFPWKIEISPAGVADESIGLFGMGWVGLLLAGGALGLAWYRLTQPGALHRARSLALAGVGICGAGLLWSVVSLAATATVETSMVGNPHDVSPGPGYGLFIHLVAWTVAGIGAVVSLKDLPTPSRRR